MSFPPVLPAPALPVQWATTTNYPAGGNPWNGTATKDVPGYSYFTPGVAPSGQELNSLFNTITGDYTSATSTLVTAVNALAQFSPSLGQNYPYSGIADTESSIDQAVTNAYWDPYNYVWIYWAYNLEVTSAPLIHFLIGGNYKLDTATTSTTTTRIGGVATEPGKIIVLWDGDDTVFKFSVNGGNTFNPSTAIMPTELANLSFAQIGPSWESLVTYFNGNFYFMTSSSHGVSGSQYTARLFYAPSSGYSATTVWVDITSSLPTGFLGQSTDPPLFRVVVANGKLVYAKQQNVLHQIALLGITTPTTLFDMTVNLPFPGGFDPESLCGLCYSDLEDRLVLSVNEVASASKLLSMPSATIITTTGSGWTIDHAFTNPFTSGDLACTGAMYFQTVPSGTAPGIFGSFSSLYIGVSRINWGLAPGWASVVGQLSDSDSIAPIQFLCNGNQCLGLMTKHWVASSFQSLPPAPTGFPL